MMNLLQQVLQEINATVAFFPEPEIERVAVLLHQKRSNLKTRFFVNGEGRSGLMAKAFAMRLMHIGYPVYVVGETVTPSIGAEDVVIAISGSGASGSVVGGAEKSAKIGAFVLAMTNRPESPLAKASDTVVTIPGATKLDKGEDKHSIQLLSSLFDQSLHIILDCICLRLSQIEKQSEEDARSRHF